jgi:hypothetical protein
MGCCNDTIAVVPTIGTPDPHQHVNYVKGMVLGVADYSQEFAYLIGRSEWMARDLIGYGTASGLRVTVEDDGSNGPRIHIAAGSALAPSGKMICVGRDQCGSIQGWLDKPENSRAVAARVSGSPPDPAITLYVTLCYRDCAIAPVPVPGEPCRSEEALMQPSRIADDYCLDFRLTAPEQWEADAIAAFSGWLDDIADVGPASPPLGEDQWAVAIRAALGIITGDVEDGSPPIGSPPIPPLPPGVSTDDFDAFLRLAYRIWITEFRPRVMARSCIGGGGTHDDCVLLAAITVAVSHVGTNAETGWKVEGLAADISIDERRRPLIAPLHLVQTALGIMTEGDGGALLSPPPGPPGPQGNPGDPGGVGPTGATGPQGPAGPQGPQGPQGEQGPPGAGGGGTVGPPGPEGPAGPQGIPGETGPAGPAGENGAAGEQGATGPIGPVGPLGPQGPAGPVGPAAGTGPFRLRIEIGNGRIQLNEKLDVFVANKPSEVILPLAKDEATGGGKGRVFTIRDLNTRVTVVPQDGDTLPDAPNLTRFDFSENRAFTFISDGDSRWIIIADKA